VKTTTFSLGRHAWGMGMTTVTLIVGGWQMLAPFALGYQPYGTSWTQQATNDFWTGFAVVVISLAGLALFGAWLGRDVRALTPAPAKTGAAAPVVEPTEGITLQQATSSATDLDRAMAALAAALASDLAERRRRQSREETEQADQSSGSDDERRAA